MGAVAPAFVSYCLWKVPMPKQQPLNVLIVDDVPVLADFYKKYLEKGGKVVVTTEANSGRARDLARRQLFDILVIDAKLPYRGDDMGGLRLADDLRPRYGANSILAISQFITPSMLSVHESDHEFMRKAESLEESDIFVTSLRQKIDQLWKRQFVFVAMPFVSKFSALYEKHIKPGIAQAGFRCVRIDEVPHTRGIQEQIFKHVTDAKVLVFVADDGNPNAYYEAGFADALQKEVVIVAKSIKELKFDVSNRHTITYGMKLAELRDALSTKLLGLRASTPFVV